MVQKRMTKKIIVGVVFENEMAERFEMAKNHHGLQSNADFLRYLVSMEAERVARK